MEKFHFGLWISLGRVGGCWLWWFDLTESKEKDYGDWLQNPLGQGGLACSSVVSNPSKAKHTLPETNGTKYLNLLIWLYWLVISGIKSCDCYCGFCENWKTERETDSSSCANFFFLPCHTLRFHFQTLNFYLLSHSEIIYSFNPYTHHPSYFLHLLISFVLLPLPTQSSWQQEAPSLMSSCTGAS